MTSLTTTKSTCLFFPPITGNVINLESYSFFTVISPASPRQRLWNPHATVSFQACFHSKGISCQYFFHYLGKHDTSSTMFIAFLVKMTALSITSFTWRESGKGNTERCRLYSPPEEDRLSPLLTALLKCQTLAKREVSQLFDVLNMKYDHRTKQLPATSTCQKQSTPIIIEFLSCMHLLCRHRGVTVSACLRKYTHGLHPCSSKGLLPAVCKQDPGCAFFCPDGFESTARKCERRRDLENMTLTLSEGSPH